MKTLARKIHRSYMCTISAPRHNHTLTDMYSVNFNCVIKRNNDYYVMLNLDTDNKVTMPNTIALLPKNDNTISNDNRPTALEHIHEIFRWKIYSGLQFPVLKYPRQEFPRHFFTQHNTYTKYELYYKCYINMDMDREPNAINEMLAYNNENHNNQSFAEYTSTITTLRRLFERSRFISPEYYELVADNYRNGNISKLYFLKIYSKNNMTENTVIKLNEIPFVKQHRLLIDHNIWYPFDDPCILLDNVMHLAYDNLSSIINRTINIDIC